MRWSYATDSVHSRSRKTARCAIFVVSRTGGRAALIEYDVSAGTVKLSDDAWLTDGRNEISGPRLVYSIRDERVQAAGREGEKPGAQDRVRITIVPREGEGRTP